MQSQSVANGFHQSMEDGNPSNNEPHGNQPTPLFERLVTEEVQELKSCLRMIDNQQRRLNELERVHGDLETRLEQESRGRVQLETTLEQREREWASKFKELETDRDHWKEIVKQEKSKNAKLIHQVVRKDQDIHRMLQRKVRFCLLLCFFGHFLGSCPISDMFSMIKKGILQLRPIQHATYDIWSASDKSGNRSFPLILTATPTIIAQSIEVVTGTSSNTKVLTKFLLQAVLWRRCAYGTCRICSQNSLPFDEIRSSINLHLEILLIATGISSC